MSRYRDTRLRIVRRLGELPGLISPKNYSQLQSNGLSKGFGQRKGESEKKQSQDKESQYSVRLKEKQKVRFYYGVTESQLLKYVRGAGNANGSTGELVLHTLEMRLDNVVFLLLEMSPTIASARQLISDRRI